MPGPLVNKGYNNVAAAAPAVAVAPGLYQGDVIKFTTISEIDYPKPLESGYKCGLNGSMQTCPRHQTKRQTKLWTQSGSQDTAACIVGASTLEPKQRLSG
jgi:hypothetical protein